MTEEEARTWIATRWGGSAVETLDRLAALVAAENQQQNLISATTVEAMWVRHLVDSAQLVTLAAQRSGVWIDVGTGGGFPGLVVAALRPDRTILVEPRRRRADFLAGAASALRLAHVEVRCGRIEDVEIDAAIVSARAVAPSPKFLRLAAGVTTPDTLFLLPSGRDAEHALVELKQEWQGVFHVEQSVTHAASKIIVASGVRPR